MLIFRESFLPILSFFPSSAKSNSPLLLGLQLTLGTVKVNVSLCPQSSPQAVTQQHAKNLKMWQLLHLNEKSSWIFSGLVQGEALLRKGHLPTLSHREERLQVETCLLDECPHAEELRGLNWAVCGCTALSWVFLETGSAPSHLVLQMFSELKFWVGSGYYCTSFSLRKNLLPHTSGLLYLNSYWVGLVERTTEWHLHRCQPHVCFSWVYTALTQPHTWDFAGMKIQIMWRNHVKLGWVKVEKTEQQ